MYECEGERGWEFEGSVDKSVENENEDENVNENENENMDGDM